MRYRAGMLSVCVIAAATLTIAQAPAFDVASVKVNRSGAQASRIAAPRGTGRFDVTNALVHTLILNAFGLQNFQLAGGPSWISNTRFDIAARTNTAASRDDLSAMLRTLLADRFHLETHREPRDMPTYALLLAREGHLGPQLTRTTTDCEALIRAAAAAPPGPPPTSANGQTLCGTSMTPSSLNAGNLPMAGLATTLSGIVGRMVKDETGLDGAFDLQLTFTPERSSAMPGGPAAPPIDANAPSIFAALNEQLGLKLEARRAPVDVLVVDRVEMPSED